MDNMIRTSASGMNFIFILLLALFLTSCSSTHISRKDGPPNYYVDETRVPNATPKTEALARHGNMPWYNVFGKRYYTMKSSKNYDQVGIASWYGTMFHARRTSSGEPYNMLGMTAAHKTLPLPTYVEVTNLKNHRKIIVKVNDRGPFATNRIIDLSYVAAKKLGMLGHGTATVRVRAIDPNSHKRQRLYMASRHARAHVEPAPAIEALITDSKSTRLVYLQVGAFHNRLRAKKLQLRLMALLAIPVKVSNPSARGLYRVQVGPFKDMATANKITHRLRILGIKPNKTYGA
jgi:rare lipoprotein A